MVGIDVSKWNGGIDFNRVKSAGIKFVIIRAGFGVNGISSRIFVTLHNLFMLKAEVRT